MPIRLPLHEFLDQEQVYVLIDVRSPSEFAKGHIPSALNLPILNDEERALVGTTYKQKGKQEAVLQGFSLAGPKFESMMRMVLDWAGKKKVHIYCWRGGLRSQISSWLFQMAGLEVSVLEDGYKAYRNWVLQHMQLPEGCVVLGGMTGSGKTLVLQALEKKGEQILDLEKIASHKGSAFGKLGQEPQPTDEQFTNLLAHQLSQFDASKRIWIENESRYIGKIKIPDAIFESMRKAMVLELSLPKKERIAFLKKEYCQFPLEELKACTEKLDKKLGGLRLKQAIDFLQVSDFENWLDVLLAYYDENYRYGNSLRNPLQIFVLHLNTFDIEEMAMELLGALQHLKMDNKNEYNG